ncbi:MAG: DUF1992 domain-containing protein [Rubrivivax sp.]|nr:DUF1992 domain-containing protein [Rubrivivax sp.]MDP3224262.1 DUF1992 domain-containing protein [Rubrivivax sp.]MDP3614151.1 DUF1992 domain-containing protein [Rubrivivax sp.]
MNTEGSSAAEKREQRLKLLEDDIGRQLAESHRSGELRSAPSYGKPLNLGDGYDETPAELRMGMKILKDAGVVPPEVELMQQIEAQRQRVEAAPDDTAARQQLADMRQRLALRLEKLRGSGTL